jgi:hypothetical protein
MKTYIEGHPVEPLTIFTPLQRGTMNAHDNEIEIKHQDIQHDDDVDNKQERDSEPQQIQAFDKLSVWQAAKMYRKIGLVCFLAAFSASLDGYQGMLVL